MYPEYDSTVESTASYENSISEGISYAYGNSSGKYHCSPTIAGTNNWVTTDGTITLRSNIDDIERRISKLEGPDMTTAFDYLDEDDLLHIADKLKERDFDYYKSFITRLVSTRHFSEEFLLRYVADLSKEVILKMHKAEILSQEYITLATRFALLGK